MAAANPAPINDNIVSGKVLLKESGLGIPDLLVVIYDFDPDVKTSEDDQPSTPGAVATTSPGNGFGDRLGSVLTAIDGSWSLEYQDREFQIGNSKEKRPDLHLLVLGPEDADTADTPAVLYHSKLPRMNSGRREAALIRIASKQLQKLGIAIPAKESDQHNAVTTAGQIRADHEARRAMRVAVRDVVRDIEVEEKPEREAFRATIEQTILPDLSKVDSRINLVTRDNPIDTAQSKALRDGTSAANARIQARTTGGGDPVPGEGIKVHLALTDADFSALQSFTVDGHTYYQATEAQIDALMFKRENDEGVGAALFADNPVSKYCFERTADLKCAEMHAGDPPGPHGDGHDDGGSGPSAPPQDPPTPLTGDDIPALLANIFGGNGSSPLFTPGDYGSRRPDSESVQNKVDTFSLRKGPADATAFYDFHSLQVAFPHVWQQVIDTTLVNLADKIDQDLETSGRKGLLSHLHDQLAVTSIHGHQNLVAALANAKLSFSQTVPSEIAAAFDISFLEYDALSNSDKVRLREIANAVNAEEPYFQLATAAAVRREQGERIIDNVRVNKLYSTNAMLKELQERLLSAYEFTIFAATKDHHSVNFGLMNTFRQKWEPISYQAGKLVKTMPLAPKEERKYSSKIKQNLKIAQKQAIKNNSSLQIEISTTNRAESEIVAKAHDKSNFNMTAKVDYSHFSSQIGFSKDAEKDTSQTKKDFREAVIKAAQEYKEERSIEVTTEQSYSSDYEESGTIVNPNDELSLTCLFYELQRRYRVSEQLYRVMPVVLVAQQVPAPNEITEAWVVANDWILNRVLLDDSYRPTLAYIAQRNVGDDFSIRELRKNLRHQRILVNNLQLEFAKLKRDVENKYAAMETAIRDRIDQEHVKRTTTWWDYLWDEDERPDPEMAKALEQAATDEHKYAVEKAQNMALAVQREVNALQQITTDYTQAMEEYLDRLAQVRRLLAHFKNNILYYMQAIWSMEPPDQRYMRLYKVMVPQFEATRTLVIDPTPEHDIFESFRPAGTERYTAWLHGAIATKDGTPEGEPDITYKPLVEVADLDTVLGFKANCIVFPLKAHNPITEFMAAPFVDDAFGAMDPDQLSNVSLEEFSKYICCLAEHDPVEFERVKPVLKLWLKQLLADPLRNGDEIIVPTGSLFIELLPSDKSLLEDFKLKHREWDVYKVQAEVRKLELENVRYAARLLGERLDDPDIDKQIFVSPGAQPVIDVDA